MKTAVVTGASSGIGFAVCRALMKQEWRVVGIGRSEENCRKAAEALKSEYPAGQVTLFSGDLLRQSEVLRVGAAVRAYLDGTGGGALHALINNAGCVRGGYVTTEDGYEQQFALNHLAGFLLTYQLMPCLLRGRGRVLMTSSGSHRGMRVRWHDVMFKRRYHPLLAYKQSKLCNLLFARGLNERFAEQGIKAYGVDPGLVKTDIGFKQAGGLVRLVWRLRRRGGVEPELPARTYAYLCGEEETPDGFYYCLCSQTRCSDI
jgi:NAD(P)-dependent dehydrogenase (short-subunit alcohol dehydrogenase family)